MTANSSQAQRAARRIVALAAVILAIVTSGAAGLLAHTAISVDQVQVEEERRLVSSRIKRTLEQIVTDISSATVWDEAYVKVGPTIDQVWADTNLGGYYADYMDHDITVVLDSQDRTVHAWRDDARQDPAAVAAFSKSVAPFVARLRARERLERAMPRPPLPIGLNPALTTSGVVLSNGQYYLVGATTVRAENASVPQRPRTEIVVSARRMDGSFLTDLDRDLRVRDARLGPAKGAAKPGSTEVVDINGAVVGRLSWTPKRPGVQVLIDAIPAALIGGLVLLGAALALALRIKSILRGLATRDAALGQTMSELVRARDQADSANVAKSQFLANMSHEIRTPLNGILGMAQVMAREDLSAPQAERLTVIRASGQALLTVLNDVLDISKIEAGRFEIDNHEFNLAEAVEGASRTFMNLATQKDVTLGIRISDEARGIWWGDGSRIRQVISNLVSNGVKFTGDGEVSVSVDVVPQGLAFAVSDTGIGIPAEQIGGLFQKFSQVDAAASRKYGGTGLGLAISRELVELMGGHMTVSSTEGLGSTFSFTLPLERRGDEQAAARPEPGPAGPEEVVARILAAEDNLTNQLILKSLLEPAGVSLTLVANGREAIEAVMTSDFDLVLMDIQMPEMNGVDATVEIRRHEARLGRPPMPILALSANVMSHQVQEYMDAGMSGFIPKPIDVTALFQALDEALSPVDEVAEAEAAA